MRITTVEQLDALPIGTPVRAPGMAWRGFTAGGIVRCSNGIPLPFDSVIDEFEILEVGTFPQYVTTAEELEALRGGSIVLLDIPGREQVYQRHHDERQWLVPGLSRPITTESLVLDAGGRALTVVHRGTP